MRSSNDVEAGQAGPWVRVTLQPFLWTLFRSSVEYFRIFFYGSTPRLLGLVMQPPPPSLAPGHS